MKTFEEFEKEWEAFRIEEGIKDETFVSEGYGFVENLYEFVNRDIFKLEKENEKLKSLLSQLDDEEPCEYDQHGDCQTHGITGLGAEACPYTKARNFLK